MTRRRISSMLSIAAAIAAVCALAALAGAQSKPDSKPKAAAGAKAGDEAGDKTGERSDGKSDTEKSPNGAKADDAKADDAEPGAADGAEPGAADGADGAGDGAAAPLASPHARSLIGDRDCSECHTPDGWSLASGGSGGFDHAQTGFPLTGTHGYVACTSCHGSERSITRECAGCHVDAHKGRLGRSCDQCHNSSTWYETRAIERHRRTRLPLTGVHALIDCTSCHIRSIDNTYAPVAAECFACHEKDYRDDIHPVHQGDPENPGLAQFPRDCRGCHRPTGWTPAVVNPATLPLIATSQQALRSHDRRFPLSFGKHRGARCESCHTSSRSMRLVSCTGCHVHSPTALRKRHGGAVVAVDAAGCLRCHPGGIAR